MDVSTDAIGSAELASSTCIPIAALDPSQSPPASTSIRAVVSLLWPYSSSHRTFALLLAEPDFRLRSKKGQIRIQFNGSIAEALARSHVGIGDHIHLSLSGAQWVEDTSNVKTPGRSVDADLLFKSKLLLQIQRDGELFSTLSLEQAESPSLQSPVHSPIATSEHHSILQDVTRREDQSGSWKTPARFRTSLRAQGPSPSSSFDLFGDEDAFDERPTKRSKLWESSHRWRLIDRDLGSPRQTSSETPSKHLLSRIDAPPTSIELAAEDTNDQAQSQYAAGVALGEPGHPGSVLDGTIDLVSTVDDGTAEHVESEMAPTQMSAPKLPQIRTDMEESTVKSDQNSSKFVIPSSPALEPIASAILPQVSPITFSQDTSLTHHYVDYPRKEALVAEFTGENDSSNSLLAVDGLNSSYSSFVQDGRSFREVSSSNLLQPSPKIPDDIPRVIEEHDMLSETERYAIVIIDSEEEDAVKAQQIRDGNDFEDKPRQPALREAGEVSKPAPNASGKMMNEILGKDPNSDRPLQIEPSTERNIAAEPEPSVAYPDIGATELFKHSIVQDFLAEKTDTTEFGKYATSSVTDQTRHENDLYSRATPVSEVLESPQATGDALEKLMENDAAEAQSQSLPTPETSQGMSSQIPPKSSSLGHRVDDILDGRFPPTPQSSAIPPHMLKTPTSTEIPQDDAAADQTTKLLKSARKSSGHRSSEVPNVISTWFTSRRQSAPQVNDETGAEEQHRFEILSQRKLPQSPHAIGLDLKPERQCETQVAGTAMFPGEGRLSSLPINGLRTPLSYYHPVASMSRHVNDSSQVGENLIDVIAIVGAPIPDPSRSKSGRKDFYVYLDIIDISSSPQAFQVRIFRPFRVSLPLADAGDVILLRNFSVKSRAKEFFLLSGDSSAWCVWRYKKESERPANSDLPIWAKKKRGNSEVSEEEECKGPPVEIGPEERQYALAMKYWWESLGTQNPVLANDITNGHDLNVISSDQEDRSIRGIAVGN